MCSNIVFVNSATFICRVGAIITEIVQNRILLSILWGSLRFSVAPFSMLSLLIRNYVYIESGVSFGSAEMKFYLALLLYYYIKVHGFEQLDLGPTETPKHSWISAIFIVRLHVAVIFRLRGICRGIEIFSISELALERSDSLKVTERKTPDTA